MHTSQDWELIGFLGVLTTNALIGVTCRLTAPRRWTAHICLATLLLNGLLLAVPVVMAFRRGIDPYIAVLFLPWALILLEFLGLLHIYDLRFRSQPER